MYVQQEVASRCYLHQTTVTMRVDLGSWHPISEMVSFSLPLRNLVLMLVQTHVMLIIVLK